jgi:hypothetical protein
MTPPAEKMGMRLAERLAPARRVQQAETMGVWPAVTQYAQALAEVLGPRFPQLVVFCAGLAVHGPPKLSPKLSHSSSHLTLQSRSRMRSPPPAAGQLQFRLLRSGPYLLADRWHSSHESQEAPHLHNHPPLPAQSVLVFIACQQWITHYTPCGDTPQKSL